MKISKSKKELARIISENGGWNDGCDFAVQDRDSWVCSYKGRPTRLGDAWKDNGDCLYRFGFQCDTLLPNWHQTILSRDEYFQLYPAPDADGWIEWNGGACPVDDGVSVEVKRERFIEVVDNPEEINWVHYGTIGDIIAYRLHKPERAKPEFCESVMRSIPDPEAKPTIEQLAADYLAKLDIATLAQEEADAHRCGAEVALGKLEIALKDLGFKIEPITAKQEPELVITDWRDLRVGDEIEYLDSSCSFTGLVGTVELIDYDEGESYHILFRHGDRGVSDDPAEWVSTRWCREFRFIRRP